MCLNQFYNLLRRTHLRENFVHAHFQEGKNVFQNNRAYSTDKKGQNASNTKTVLLCLRPFLRKTYVHLS